MEKDMEVHNKLVRSKVIKKLRDKKISHTFETVSPLKYEKLLYEKGIEEATELAQSRNKEEMIDVLEWVEAVKKLNGWTTEELEILRLEKREKEGNFEEPIMLLTSEKRP